jgi:beta-glucanase (GH16 family)
MNGVRLFILLAAVAAMCAPMAGAQDDLGAPFVDHFQQLDAGRWLESDGWSNGSWTANDWRRAQIGFGNRGAQITLARNSGGAKPYSSGELQTHTLYRYGYFEARLQAPRGSGLVTGFFTYIRPGGESTWNEIDVEIVGRDTRSIQYTYYRSGAKRYIVVPLGFDAADAPHSYAFDWQPDHIRWYVDGRLLHEETGDGLPLPTAPQRLFLDLWNTTTLTDWLGPIQGQGPWVLRASCVAQAPTFPGHTLC